MGADTGGSRGFGGEEFGLLAKPLTRKIDTFFV